METDVTIRRYLDLAEHERDARAIDAIFFAASLVKAFADEEERQAFRERWLGRYLREQSRYAYLALDDRKRVLGYLVGSPTTPTSDANPFAGSTETLQAYPAHLHVNVDEQARKQGIGARLIEAFAQDVEDAGVTGLHVVTAAQSDNVRFYNRNGFAEIARSAGAKPLVLLGRKL